MQKFKIGVSMLIFTTVFLAACSKKESTSAGGGNNTTLTLPQDTVTTFMVYFTNTSDSSTEVASYDDADGPGPLESNIGGVALKANSTYKVTFFIEDATQKSAPVYLHTKIKNNGTQYKICISNPLNTTVNPLDSDGVFPIGLVNNFITTGSTGDANVNFTIKYQKDVKNGSCSPGQVYFSCNIPVSIL